MFITKITGKSINEENYENTLGILKDALEVGLRIKFFVIFNAKCAKSIGDNKTANLCICNMGVLEGNKKFSIYSQNYLPDNIEMI